MTDFQKIDQLGPETMPKFTTSRKGGYTEDIVDEWLNNFITDVGKVIDYQNKTVDALVVMENERDEALANVHRLEEELKTASTPVVDENALEALRQEQAVRESEIVAAYEARIVELNTAYEANLEEVRANSNAVVDAPVEATVAPVAHEHFDEVTQATSLLAAAERTAQDYIAAAKVEADNVVADAKSKIGSLQTEIRDLEALRFATHGSLTNFFSEQLDALRNHGLFESFLDAPTAETDEETVAQVEDAVRNPDAEIVVGEVREASAQFEEAPVEAPAVVDEEEFVGEAPAEVEAEIAPEPEEIASEEDEVVIASEDDVEEDQK